MVFLNGESDKKVLREKLLDIIKKSDKDGSFFDYLERKSFQVLDQLKKTKKDIYLPIKRQKRKLGENSRYDPEMTVIYEEEKENNEDQFFPDLLPQLSPLSRTISELVQSKGKNEYKALKQRHCLKTVHELRENNIE